MCIGHSLVIASLDIGHSLFPSPSTLMKTKLLLLLAVLLPLAAHAADDLSTALQKGLFEEEANQNLPAAIQAYQSLLAASDDQRKLAATALFRLGECYRKLGKTNDAVAQYQRILRDYADQGTLATLSRQNLTGLGVGNSSTSIGIAATSRTGSIAAAELARTESILAQLKGWDLSQLRRLIPQLVPDTEFEQLDKELKGYEDSMRPGILAGHEKPFGPEGEKDLALRRQRVVQRADEILRMLEVRAESLRQKLKDEGLTGYPTSSGPDAASSQEATKSAMLLEQLREMSREQLSKVLPTVAPDALLNTLLEQRADTERRLASAKVSFSADHPSTKSTLEGLKVLERQIDERIDGILNGLTIKAAALNQDTVTTTGSGGGDRAGTVAPVDEEQNEIRRIQAIIKDSPDLINALNVEVTKVRSGELMLPRNGTLLHKAASLGQLRVVTFLLDHGADIGARDQSLSQNTPLHWAAVNGHRAMVELLLSRKADPNAMSIPDGSTPLLLATKKSFRSVCEALLARGANANLPDSASEAPLDAAASRGDEAIVRLLLDKGAEVNRKSKSGTTPLHRTSSTNIARLLLERGAEVNAQDEQGRSPLFGAAERDQRELLQFLLAQEADAKLPNKIGWTPLHAAANAGAASVITLLIQNGADPNQQDGSKRVPLDFVIRARENSQPPFANYPETLKALLAGGANPNPPGDKVSTLLYRAVAEGSEQMAEMLLKAGANPNVKMDAQMHINIPSMTPLLRALYNAPSLSLVTLLLEHKADPNLKTDNGFAPVHWVLASGRERILEALLTHGADPDARNGDGQIPLGHAVEIGSKETVALLLKFKADPNGKSHSGQSPLHIAVLKDKRDVVDLLLAANANPNATDEKGLSPLDYVKPKARQDAASADMAEKLRKAGALDWAPRPNQITITRRGRSFSQAVFQRGTNTWNNHTLFELIASAGFCAGCPELAFPDFSNIRISRVAPGANQMSDTTVDVLGSIALGDCRANVPLQWGDLVEIPEIEHKRNEAWTGLTADFAKGIAKCLERNVFIIVKGQQHEIPIKVVPTMSGVTGNNVGIDFRFNLAGLRLNTAVLGSSHVLSSSDLTNVRVIRPKDPQHPQMGYLGTSGFNLEDKTSPAAEFWLREGDKIEVPEKGANAEPAPAPPGRLQPGVRLIPPRANLPLPVLPPPVLPEPK
jgi:ankyrin repeat protein/tetratricopeptide (TPR) repeat protein